MSRYSIRMDTHYPTANPDEHFSRTGAISRDRRDILGTSHDGSGLHWCGQGDACGSEPAAHNMLPEQRAQASSPAPRGFPRSAEHGLCGAHYELRSRLLGVTGSVFTMARGGRVSVLTTSAFAGCWRIPTSNCPAVLT